MSEMETHVPTPVAYGPEIISELAKAAHDLRHRLTVATERLAAAESRLSACLAEIDKLKGALETADRALYSERERIVAAERSKVAAESRAERLAEALREIDARTGHFGEAPPPPEWMPMLSLIAWVGRISRDAIGEEGPHV